MTAEDQRRKIAEASLQAQLALLPYMVGAFVIGLILLLTVAAAAGSRAWLAVCLAVFAVNWAVVYGAGRRLRSADASVAQRTRAHVLAGMLWAAALLPLTAFAETAGPLRDTVLLLCIGAAAVIAFFTAAHLPSLLMVGPAAAAAPLMALHLEPASRGLGDIALGGLALAFALAMILNRSLRRQFVLAAEGEALMAERAEALAEAERLARSKSDLVATLSGEVRTGMAGVERVLAAAAGSGRRSRGAPTAEQLNVAHEAARELVVVLDTTLTAEEAEAGRLLLHPEPFDPFRLTHDVTAAARSAASAKGVELMLELEPGVWGLAHADPARVRQVVEALVGNAVRYTVRGRVEVRLLRAGDALRVEVADTGPGLSAEEAQAAFEPFTRVPRTALGTNGAGLGLTLARRLVRLMGSELQVEAAVGVGARFWFDLPFSPAPEPAPAPAESAPSPSAQLRVLIAEDDLLDAALLRSALEQLGHKVLHAHDGARALSLLRRAEVDLVVAEAVMPGLTGAELVSRMRADPALAGVPVVAVAGGDPAEARALQEAGADALLRKPVTPAAVARAAAEAAASRSRPARAAA